MTACDMPRISPFADLTAWLAPLAVAVAMLLAPLSNPQLAAQGLSSEEAIDAIVGSDVKTEEADAVEQERVLAAIENTMDTVAMVRKAFNLNGLEIVLLQEDDERMEAIEAAIAERQEGIEALRQSIEGSAMFYHAVDSRSIQLRDIVAAEFGDDSTVTIFVRARAQ